MPDPTLTRLLALPRQERQHVIAQLPRDHRRALAQRLQAHRDNPWMRYDEDPVGFVTEGLHEVAWSRQRDILESLKANKRTTVSAGHAPGKTHIASRAVSWWGSVHPPGTAQVITTATVFRQVRNVLWPHVRKLHARHGLPGYTNQVEWHIPTGGGADFLAAYGFSAEGNDEAAVQGVHHPHLLIVVDEAGGISHTLGTALESLMTGGHTRLLVIGNPPTDEEGTWFEQTTLNPLYEHIRISAFDTPNFTGEDAGTCASCPPEVAAHSVATHLVDQAYVDDVATQFGTDSPFYIARVQAEFPKNSASRTIPTSWLEAASLERTGREQRPGIIRLGVDVASDGGDELAIGAVDGTHARIVATTRGLDNENAVVVAGYVLPHILWAEQQHQERGLRQKVEVKIDALGVGWGVVGILETWRKEGRHGATIVPVKVSRSPRVEGRFKNQRAEMWWAGREAFQARQQPDGTLGPTFTLEQDNTPEGRKLLAQLSGPKYTTNSTGMIEIEKKTDMKKRGVPSPDRAEGVLLALYDPPGQKQVLAAPVSVSSGSSWRVS